MMKNSVQSERLCSCTQTLRSSPPYMNVMVCAKINSYLHSSLQSSKLFHVTDTMTSEPLQNECDSNWEDHLNLSFQTEDIKPIWTLKDSQRQSGRALASSVSPRSKPRPTWCSQQVTKRENRTFQLYHLLQSTKVERSANLKNTVQDITQIVNTMYRVQCLIQMFAE